jgi:hypothetical protein
MTVSMMPLAWVSPLAAGTRHHLDLLLYSVA